jgi:hypothetical protein
MVKSGDRRQRSVKHDVGIMRIFGTYRLVIYICEFSNQLSHRFDTVVYAFQ